MNDESVRSAIATAVAGISGVSSLPYVPDSVVTPCFFIAEGDIDYDRTMSRGMHSVIYACRFLVARADDLTAQKTLSAYVSSSGASSLKVAIESTRPQYGGSAGSGAFQDLHVQRVQSHRLYEHAGTEYLGVELTVYVIGA